jgi:nanoRNase/pAp phosphatase (c-di-AMP/oligoRNAs hydrolase)
VELSYLYGIDKITKQIAGGNNLVVSMPYKDGSIEKVSYHIENNRFNLVIEPRGERLDFDPNQIEYNYGRGDYDVAIVLGANNIAALGELYQRHKNIFTQKPIINIDKSPNNTKFGRINIVEEVPVSQTITQLIKDMRLPIDQDAASNLYTGIVKMYGSATVDALDPKTIDSLAFLARLNAQNLNKGKSEQSEQNSGTIQVKQQSTQIEQSNGVQQKEAPEDWLKPKIFTSKQEE